MEERLKEERLRLGLLQAFVANECDVTSRTIILWEQGRPVPADKLAALARLGFDVQYIVTGVRSTNLNQAQDDVLQARIARLSDTQRDVIGLMLEELERANEKERLAKELASKVKRNGVANK
jgi:DNA-binding XRE family transcriptional regulator